LRAAGSRREQVVVDGKALRGTRHHTASGRARHLLAACTGRGVVIARAEFEGKTNEIPAFAPLLRPLDRAGVVVTADALHTQRDHAIVLAEENKAHYILTVKKNQPSLHRQLKKLPWRQIRTAHTDTHHGHGRTERRSVKVCSLSDQKGQGLLFPHAAQAICITRKTRPRNGGRWKTVTVYAVTGLAAHQARPFLVLRERSTIRRFLADRGLAGVPGGNHFLE
jgi:predicted transposase YbfD/YdcC